jgi:bacterioferritin-associated ferredoxin
MTDGQVDRCVCMNVTFAQMKAHIERSGERELDDLRKRFGCGRGCALCVPYLRAMLATGRTSFAVNDEAVVRAAEPTERPPTL